MTQRSATPYHHGDVRAAAVEATIESVRRSGVGEVTVRSLATTIGVTHAALYRHVGSVDELLDRAAAWFLEGIVADMPGDESVRAFLTRYVERAIADPHLYRLAFERGRGAERSPSSAAALRTLRIHVGQVFATAWPDDSRSATMHRVIRTWSTVHGMLDLASLGLVATERPTSLARYVVRSALRSAEGV